MGKKFIITEEEKNRIREMYNLDEGWAENFKEKLLNKGIEFGKKIFKKVTGRDVEDVTIEDLKSMNLQQKGNLEKEMEPVTHSIKNDDIVTVVNGDNRGMRFRVIFVEGNTITVDLGHGDTYDYKASDLRLEPAGTKSSIPDVDNSPEGAELQNFQKWDKILKQRDNPS